MFSSKSALPDLPDCTDRPALYLSRARARQPLDDPQRRAGPRSCAGDAVRSSFEIGDNPEYLLAGACNREENGAWEPARLGLNGPGRIRQRVSLRLRASRYNERRFDVAAISQAQSCGRSMNGLQHSIMRDNTRGLGRLSILDIGPEICLSSGMIASNTSSLPFYFPPLTADLHAAMGIRFSDDAPLQPWHCGPM